MTKPRLSSKSPCGCGYLTSGDFFMCPMHDSAPDLLAALEDIEGRISDQIADGSDLTGARDVFSAGLCRTARAAIAKAKGVKE